MTGQNKPASDMPIALSTMINLRILDQTLKSCVDDSERPNDIPLSDVYLLVHLTKPKRIGQLADEMQVLRSSMTATADRLEQQGYIERIRDQDDRRAWILALTAKGRDIQSQVFEDAETIFHEVTQLSEQDIKTLDGLFKKIRTNMKASGYSKGLDI